MRLLLHEKRVLSELPTRKGLFFNSEFFISSVMSYAIGAYDITTPVGALTGWGSICGQNMELYWKMVINLYTHCKHQWIGFREKKNRKFTIFHRKILGFRWIKMFPNLSNHWILGFLWTPFLSPHRGHNSLAFLWFGASSQSTHVAVAGVNPKVNPNSPWFSYGSPCFFWKWLFSETIFGDCLDKTMRLMNCIIYQHLGYLWVKWWLFVGFLLDFFTSNSPRLTSSGGPVELKILAMPRSAKKTELSQTVALLQSYMCFFLLFSMFLILLVLIR